MSSNKQLSDNTQALEISTIRRLSPLRNTSTAVNIEQLVEEQIEHFGIDIKSDYGATLSQLAHHLYASSHQVQRLWDETLATLGTLDKVDRVAYFNAKRFICFQLAKLLDLMQNPMRATYQTLGGGDQGFRGKGAYPLFGNVAALFSATPVITRTATYMFACTEWIEDAFSGREPLLEIYSRLLNPTSISLANHIVDVECGPYAQEYMAWNFNSGMAAIDSLLSHLLGREDIVLAGRNVYGGTHQLLNDWFAKGSNLNVAIDWVDGFTRDDYQQAIERAESSHAQRLQEGRQIYLYLESPCNPHGNVLDVAGISKMAHGRGWMVICDSTIGTPFLHPSLKREDPIERPDFIIHSYTKDLTGTGTTTAGVVIGKNERMFMPKHDSCEITDYDGQIKTINWDETLFWNVYYIKGAFLDSDKAFEVLMGMKTYELRVLQKCINTIVIVSLLDQHPAISVHCPILETNSNHSQLKKNMFLSLPAPLFTFDMENSDEFCVTPELFKRFFDNLEPAIGLQVSLGQTHTTALCPALTSHSELSSEALKDAGISPTTVRVSVGLEDPRLILSHLYAATKLAIDPELSGFSEAFPTTDEINILYRDVYIDVHSRFANAHVIPLQE